MPSGNVCVSAQRSACIFSGCLLTQVESAALAAHGLRFEELLFLVSPEAEITRCLLSKRGVWLQLTKVHCIARGFGGRFRWLVWDRGGNQGEEGVYQVLESQGFTMSQNITVSHTKHAPSLPSRPCTALEGTVLLDVSEKLGFVIGKLCSTPHLPMGPSETACLKKPVQPCSVSADWAYGLLIQASSSSHPPRHPHLEFCLCPWRRDHPHLSASLEPRQS